MPSAEGKVTQHNNLLLPAGWPSGIMISLSMRGKTETSISESGTSLWVDPHLIALHAKKQKIRPHRSSVCSALRCNSSCLDFRVAAGDTMDCVWVTEEVHLSSPSPGQGNLAGRSLPGSCLQTSRSSTWVQGTEDRCDSDCN